MKITFGVDSFIWTENFSEKDLWIIKKAEELGFEVIDFAIAHPETFPTERVRACENSLKSRDNDDLGCFYQLDQ